MDEAFFKGASLKARIIGKLRDGPSNSYRLKEDLNASGSAVHKQLQSLQESNIVTVEGEPQTGRGGVRLKRKVVLNPEIEVRIETQPVARNQRAVVFHETWGRIGPGTVYPKQIICLGPSEIPKYDY